MISKEQRKRLQAMTPESRKRIALLALKEIKAADPMLISARPEIQEPSQQADSAPYNCLTIRILQQSREPSASELLESAQQTDVTPAARPA